MARGERSTHLQPRPARRRLAAVEGAHVLGTAREIGSGHVVRHQRRAAVAHADVQRKVWRGEARRQPDVEPCRPGACMQRALATCSQL